MINKETEQQLVKLEKEIKLLSEIMNVAYEKQLDQLKETFSMLEGDVNGINRQIAQIRNQKWMKL